MQTSVIAAILTVYALLALFWGYAARRVAGGDFRFVAHLIGPPGLLGAALAVVAGIVVRTQPLLGLALAIFSFAYLLVVLRLIVPTYRGLRSRISGGNRLQAMAAPFVDHLTTLMRLTLVGGLLALLALVVSAVRNS
jgi:hypothetical protein